MIKITAQAQKSRNSFLLMSKACGGFTLIELLIVISIIGLLSTLLLANMFGVRQKGKDAVRKSDMADIQRALEMYKDNQVTPAYPAGSFNGLENALTDNTGPTDTPTPSPGPKSVMKAVPHDPSCSGATCSWVDYRYTRTDTLTYTLTACLENKSDPAGTTCTAADVNCSTAGGICYTKTEP